MVIATWINGSREGEGEKVVAAIEERDGQQDKILMEVGDAKEWW